MPYERIELNDYDRALVALSLRIAAEKYKENAADLMKYPTVGNAPIADLFEKQHTRALELAEYIENADQVTIKSEGD